VRPPLNIALGLIVNRVRDSGPLATLRLLGLMDLHLSLRSKPECKPPRIREIVEKRRQHINVGSR